MMQDGNDADLFESENVRGTGPRGSSRTFIVECKHCHRTVLGTRFVDHLRQCKKYARANSTVPTLTDSELPLVVSPYVWPRNRNGTSTAASDPSVGDIAVSIVTLPYMSGVSFGTGSIRRRGFQWQKRLSPLGPRRKARGDRLFRHQKMELVPMKAVPLPKKKQNTPEKRALSAASSVGLGTSKDRDDFLKFASGNWGLSAQWAKLIQCCRPIVVPRSELRKNAVIRETPLSLFVKAPNGSNQFLIAETPNSKMVPRNSHASIPKALSRHLPSLPGALLHIRGKYFKNLQGTDLGTLDISSNSIPKAIYMYHGQSFFANPGQFYSDQRIPQEVVLPISVVDTATANVRNSSHAQLNAHQAQLLSAHRSTANGTIPSTSQEPPAKKQRVSKPRPSNTPSAGGGVPPKQPLSMQRQHRTLPAGAGVANQKMNAARFQQHYTRRPGMGLAGNPGVPAAMKRSQSQPGQQKQLYRTPTAIPPSAINPNALNTPTVAASAGLKAGARSNPRNRGNVVPPHPNAQAQKLMHHGTGNVMNAFHQQVTGSSVPNRVDPTTNPLNNAAAAAEYQALIRQAGSSVSTGVAQPSMNYNQQLASMIPRGNGQKKQSASRGLTASAAAVRMQHQPNLNMLDIEQRTQAQVQAQVVQAQAVQARARAAQAQKAQAQQAQLAAAHQAQLRNYPHGSQAATEALRRFHPGAQVRPSTAIPSSVPTSSALSGRSGVTTNAGSTAGATGPTGQMFRGQQMYNSGFPVQVPQSHERSPVPQSMPLQQASNAASIAYMQQMMQGSASASALGAPMPGGNPGGRAPSMTNLALQSGHYGNVPNFFPGSADTNGSAIGQQNMNAINAARMAGLSNPGMIQAGPILSQLIPSTPHAAATANLMHGMQNSGTAAPIITAPNPVSNQGQTTSQALSDIDKALSL